MELDGSWWLLSNIIDDSANARNLIDDSSGNAAKELAVKVEPISSHVIGGFNSTESNDLVVDSLISHDTDGADWQESGEGLGNLAVKTSSLDLLNEDVVGLAGNGDLLGSNLTEDTDGDTRSWEWMAPDEILGDTKVGTELADFILEELAEGFDKLEVHVLKETTDVLVFVSN